MNIKDAVKIIFPKFIWRFLIDKYLKWEKVSFFHQDQIKFKLGQFDINCPSKHPIIDLHKVQPYRDLCVGISAKYLTEKYPKSSVLDIGANIGDTAAIIASYSKSKLILVEPSDFFFKYLSQNVTLFSNEFQLFQVLISNGENLSGTLQHWGGTAFFEEAPTGNANISKRIADVADSETSFIKIDTDGFDFKIILNNLDWLNIVKPGIIFENQIFNEYDLTLANEVFSKLAEIEYKYFIFWDDAGFYLTSTDSVAIAMDFNRYLFKMYSIKEARKSIAGYDVLCLKEADQDVFNLICKYYRQY